MSTDSWLPDRELLQHGLSTIFGDNASPTTLLERRKNTYTSSFGSEIVTCRLSNGQELELFVKYGRPGADSGQDFWGNTNIEAAVYRDILQPLSLTSATFYGAFTDEIYEYTWLVIAYLGEAYRLNRTPRARQALGWSARWLGQFHAATEVEVSTGSYPQLRAHTADYYCGWVNHVHDSTRPFHGQYPWVPTLCRRFKEDIPMLTATPQTVIHGEYYPMNILVDGERIYPIDWQTAAVARGELDLASLIEGWGDGSIVQTAIEEYCNARWQGATPADFSQILTIAQLYWPFRWLGSDPKWPDWADDDESRLDAGLEYLRLAGERAGLI
ncbi:MAG: phosphotransferase [Candidatus Promineifilaceae bacterium]